MLKIVLVTTLYPAFSGQGRGEVSYALHDMATRWREKVDLLVVRPQVVSLRQGRDPRIVPGATSIEGVTVFNLFVRKFPKRPLFFPAVPQFALTKTGFRPDIVIGHLGYNHLFAARLADHIQRPLIAGVHMGDIFSTPGMLGEERLGTILAGAAAVSCRSAPVADHLSRRYPGLAQKVFVAPSGIEKRLIQDAETVMRKVRSWKEGGRM
nr:glycosyltransferase [Candidatus Aminicenantes bacterium]